FLSFLLISQPPLSVCISQSYFAIYHELMKHERLMLHAKSNSFKFVCQFVMNFIDLRLVTGVYYEVRSLFLFIAFYTFFPLSITHYNCYIVECYMHVFLYVQGLDAKQTRNEICLHGASHYDQLCC